MCWRFCSNTHTVVITSSVRFLTFSHVEYQALVNNPKIEVRDATYGFKPKYNLKDKKALLRLLDKHDQLGLGGVLLDDVEEGLPNSAKAIKVKQGLVTTVLCLIYVK